MSVAGNAGGAPNATVRQFLEILKRTQLLSANELQEIVARWPEAKWNDDAGLLAKELVQSEKLTKYQAAAAYQCKPRGLVIGQYTILDRLGAGGMGTVFKGKHREKGMLVAIKVLASAAIKSPESVERFHREAKTAAKLHHPGIVRALEIGEGEGQHWYVMEYVEGIDLSAYLKKQGPLPLDQAVQVIVQAARALAHAHENGVVHRDIKPGNLIYTKDAQIKILDMGLARLNDPATLATAQAAEGLTQTGQVMGTVDYMAPEQAVNTRLADARADVYSLGCTFYRLATGKIPFDGESMVEKILAHREQPIPKLGSENNVVPPAVDQVLARMLAKKPDDRYQNMNDVAHDLEKSLSGEFPAGTVVGQLTLAAVEDDSSSSMTFTNLGQAAGTNAGAPTVRRKRSSGPLLAAGIAAALVIGGGTFYAMKLAEQAPPPSVVLLNEDGSTPEGATTDGNEKPTENTTGTGEPSKDGASSNSTTASQLKALTGVGTKPSEPNSDGTPAPAPVTLNPSPTPNMTPAPATPPGATPSPANNSPSNSGFRGLSISPNTPFPDNPPGTGTPGTPPNTTPTPAPPDTPSTTPPLPTTPSTVPPVTAPPVTTPVEAMIPTEIADTRKELPAQAAIDEAVKLLRNDLFKDEYVKVKKPEERAALAKKLYDQAVQTQQDDVGQYTMLREARDLAAEAGDVTLLLGASTLAGTAFKLDALEWLVDAVETAQKKAQPSVVNKQIAGALLTKLDDAVRDSKFELGERIVKAMLAAARKASDPPGLKVVADRGKQFDEEKKQWDTIEKARKSLAANADDPAANLVLGKYLCFTEVDWEHGLAHLAKGSDAVLKELGELTLKVADKPEDQAAVGDAWWTKSEKATGLTKKELQFGALYWYEKSLAGLTGLNRTKIEKRVADTKQAVVGMGAGSRGSGKAVYIRLPLSNKLSLAMRLIPAGSFVMGSPDNEQGRGYSEVQHRVTLTKPFFMGVTEVTLEQYRTVTGSSWGGSQDNPDNPISGVYRSTIDEFVSRLNSGPHSAYVKFRLPTEAEWEYAARAGTNTAFYWGDDGTRYRDYAVVGSLSPVALLRPNLWGLYDMSGNLAEFTNDYYSETAHTPVAQIDPVGPATADPLPNSTSVQYVMRGGYYNSQSTQMRSAARRGQSGTSGYSYNGFRVVCEVVGRIPPELFIRDPLPYLRVGTVNAPTAVAVSTTPSTSPATKAGSKVSKGPGGATIQPSAQAYLQIADWAWKRNGGVLLRTGTGTRTVYRSTDLPTTYDVIGIYCSSSQCNITDADAQIIAAHSWLNEVYVYAPAMTNAGVAMLTSMPNLEALSIARATSINETGFASLAKNTRLKRLSLPFCPNVGRALKHIAGCTSLEFLNLDSANVVDADCIALEGLRSLTTLDLTGARITDKALTHLRNCRSLRSLNLDDTKVTDAGMVHLQTMNQLDYLHLNNTAISSKGLALLQSCTDLNDLHLRGCKVDGSAVDALMKIRGLSTLYLADTLFNDAAVQKLTALPNLGYLDLSGCNITDACTPFLAKLPRLYSLRLSRTRITPAGTNVIKNALPNCNIY